MQDFSQRNFQLWEYRVSHGSLLIRSPMGPGISENVDLVCRGVEYLSAPRHIQGLDITEATREELENLSSLLGKVVPSSRVRVISSQGRRFPIVAASFTLSENDADIFDSPFEFHQSPAGGPEAP
jgi:hypothetical protein